MAGGRNRKFCSRECAFPKARVTAQCPVCRNEFTTRADQPGKTCSRECFYESMKRRRAETCETCGKPLERSPYQQAAHVYCSQACKHNAGRVSFECRQCGNSVTRARWEVIDPANSFCSSACVVEFRKNDPAIKAHAKAMQAAQVRTRGPTVPELLLYGLLAEIVGPDGFEKQPNILGRTPDAAIPNLRIAFQADGDYWHGPNAPATNRKADATFNALFSKEGWVDVRLWEHYLKRNPDICRGRLESAITAARLATERS